MKFFFLASAAFMVVSCTKNNDSSQSNSMNRDSLVSDSSAAIPHPAPQTDSTVSSATGTNSGSMSGGDSTAIPGSGDSAR